MESRIKKGLKLFKEGRIKKIAENSYEVQGTKKYHVKKVSGYWSCTCKDHFYRLEICKHIEGCKEYERNQGKRGNFFNDRLRNLRMKERAINEQIHKVLRQNKEYCRENGFKNDGLRKRHHRLHKMLVEVQEEIKKIQPSRTVFIG